MAHYVIKNTQLAVAVISISMLVSLCIFTAEAIMAYYEQPVVNIAADGTCLNVINFKNGDSYTCQDKDVILRKYRVTH